jgi:hypothetical protein
MIQRFLFVANIKSFGKRNEEEKEKRTEIRNIEFAEGWLIFAL